MEASDHDMIIKLVSTVEHMRNDIQEMKQTLKDRPCPGALCHEHEGIIDDHEGRIMTLETYAKIIVGVLVVLVTAFGAVIVDKVL